MIDALESRRLLSSVTFNAAAGKISITGTNRGDDIAIVRFGQAQVRVIDGGRVALTAGLANVRSITFFGGAGNDRITLGRVAIRAYLDGGIGDDSLSASEGQRNDTILGGDGDDYLFGGAGKDTLNGGNGGDRMLGGIGDDMVFVKSELPTDDFVSGGDGIDTIDLSTYAQSTTTRIGPANPDPQTITDVVLGDVEIFIGSEFTDLVYNAAGRPITVYGRGGNDTLYSGRANDTFVGGDGNDVFFGDAADTFVQ
jgi:Ca2+-binding RTX toxin-like protein